MILLPGLINAGEVPSTRYPVNSKECSGIEARCVNISNVRDESRYNDALFPIQTSN